MCTCINFKTKDNYFGRNLDLEYRFNERVVITPRDYKFKLNQFEGPLDLLLHLIKITKTNTKILFNYGS